MVGGLSVHPECRYVKGEGRREGGEKNSAQRYHKLFHACSVKGICMSILFKHTKITVYLQKQMLFL